MKIREIIILPQVRDDLAEIIEFITFNTSEENALRYTDDLIAEINKLSYLADAMAVIPSKVLAQYPILSCTKVAEQQQKMVFCIP
jgi:hypothetical protein